MIKNLHLLGAITILGLTSAAICLQLVFKEGTNSTGLVKLSNDSDTANRRLQAGADELSERLKQSDWKLGDLGERLQQSDKKLSDLGEHLQQSDKKLGDCIKEVNEQKRKVSEIDMAYVRKMELQARLLPLEAQLKKAQQDIDKLTKQLEKIALEKKDGAAPGGK